MIVLWLGTGVLARSSVPLPIPPAIIGGGGGGRGKYRGPPLEAIRRHIEDAERAARQGEAKDAADLAAKAARLARREARKADDDNAAALDAIANEIMAAGERAMRAQREVGPTPVSDDLVFEIALRLIAEAARARDEDDALVFLLLAV